MKKLFVFDLDGTLLNSKHKLSIKVRNSLIFLKNNNHEIIIATGRGKRFIDPIIDDLPFKPIVIGNNGSFIFNYENNEHQTFAKLPPITSKWMLNLAEKESTWLAIHTINSLNIVTNNQHVNGYGQTMIKSGNVDLYSSAKKMFEKINIEDILQISIHEKNAEPRKLYNQLTENEKKYAEFTTSTNYYFIANPKGIDKFTAIKNVAKTKGIEIKNIYCFGDSNNDISMIKGAGVGIAMGNATQQVKEVADIIIDTNNNDGIAKYIEEIFS